MKAEGNNIIAQSLYVLMFPTGHLPPRDENTLICHIENEKCRSSFAEFLYVHCISQAANLPPDGH